MTSPYPNPFCLIRFGADRISCGFGCEYGFFRMSEMVRIRAGVGAKADFFKSDDTYFNIVFYDKKQFFNQSHKAAIQLEIITINPQLKFRRS